MPLRPATYPALALILLTSLLCTQTWGIGRQEFRLEKYSDGYKMGRIVKVSRRGFPIKSTDLEMQVGDVGGEISIFLRPPPESLYIDTAQPPSRAAANSEERRRWEQKSVILVTPFVFSCDRRQQQIVKLYMNRVTLTHFFNGELRTRFSILPLNGSRPSTTMR